MKSEQTAIEWAHYTFNPWRGCTKVSEGCANCYAEVLSRRNPATLGEWGPSLKSGYDRLPDDKRLRGYSFAGGQLMLRVGKKVAGRELDGREWNEFPQGKGVVCG